MGSLCMAHASMCSSSTGQKRKWTLIQPEGLNNKGRYERCCALQANTVIASEASSRMEAFTDVEVNLSGAAAKSADPAAEGAPASGHAVEVSLSEQQKSHTLQHVNRTLQQMRLQRALERSSWITWR